MSLTDPTRRAALNRQWCILAITALALVAFGSAPAQGAQLSASVMVDAGLVTDTLDYVPGDSVVIIGTGFLPYETVVVQVVHADGDPPDGEGHDPWDVIADAEGNFETFWIIPYDDHVGEELLVTADGLTSGVHAETTFWDTNTILRFDTAIPDTTCAGGLLGVCVTLLQPCPGADPVPLEGYELLFFVNEGNCGVDIDHDADDSVYTDVYGQACADLPIPPIEGTYTIRVQFRGAEAPDPCPTPGSNACDPYNPAENKRCIPFSASNLCSEMFIAASSACPTPCTVVITCPADVTIDCDDSTDPSFTGTATATGGCPPITVTYSDVTDLSGCGGYTGTITRTWVATDDEANTAECVQTITVTDAIDPVITCPADVTIQCDASTDPASTGSATASDNCDASPTITYADTPNLTGCGGYTGTITRQWVATDACGNADTCVQVLTVIDTTDPILSGCPADVTVECDAIPAAATPSATDNCDPTPTIAFTETSNLTGCGGYTGTITRQWVATDACGNTASCDQIITIIDTQDPVITCPPPVTVECNASTHPDDTGYPTVTDICDPAPAITYIDTPNGGGINRTWTATDACGNAASCVQAITINDTQDPTVICPADITIQCDASTDPSNTGTATATDNCDLDPGITYVDTPDWSGCGGYTGTLTRTWTATDDVGNSASCDQIITIIDTQDPVIICPAHITIECNGSLHPSNTGSATATDICDPAPAITYADTPDLSGCGGNTGTITRTWTATDACGNSASCDQIITLVDTHDPQVFCPADITIQCDASTDPSNTGSATGTDICDPDPAITYADTPDWSGCGGYTGTITRTWTATDACGNSASCDQIITIIDTQDPVITCPLPITVECNASTHPDITGYPAVTDVCDPAPVITYSDTPNGGGIIRTWTATDACGNSATCDQIITIDDTQDPVITCPADVTIQCDASTDPSNTGSATATDNCDTSPTITYADTPDMSGCGGYTGTLTRTWTATDNVGNSVSCDQIITVVDTQDPVFSTYPSSATVECDVASIPPMVTATDNCDPDPVVDISTIVDLSGCGGYTGTVTRTWTAIDACGNTATHTQVLTVVDTQDPVITCPADITIQCDASTDPANTGTATATDACDPAPGIGYVDTPDLSGCGGYTGTITRTWTATDACGNSASCDQIITIIDTQDPVVTCPPPITIQCNESTDPANTGTATATDACDPAPAITYADMADLSGCGGYTGTITRTWTATDACGNSASCDQILTIVDTQDPVITCPPAVTVECDGSTHPDDTGYPSASDNCDPDPDVTYVDTPNGSTITRTWTATDACGNSASCPQTITVGDTQDPVIHCPANVTVECDASIAPSQTGYATATDNCDADPDITYADTPNMNGCGGYTGTITRTWTATDASSNSASCVQTITIVDNTPPAITCPPLKIFSCDDVGDFGVATATDNCDPYPSVGIVSRDSTPGGVPEEYSLVLTWEATDACGNSDQCQQTIIVNCIPSGYCMDVSIGPPENGITRPGIVEALNGTQVTVPVIISNLDSDLEMGGFDFLLCYDPTVVSIAGVQAGEAIADWEYFTYRLSAVDNCGGGCPTGQIRLLGIADMDNGYPIPEAAFRPAGVIVNLVFRVTSDRNFIGQCVPINFCWYDCVDNTVASRSGDTTFVDALVYSNLAAEVIWDEDDNALYPENARIPFVGAPDDCLGLSGPDKPNPIRCIRFFDGAICIIEPPDDRGDLNLNGIANEVGDAVLYTNYFIYGNSVWDPVYPESQILASDINEDGIVLTVADLVYLIRIMTGDVGPYPAIPKLSPYASTGNVSYRVENGAMTVSANSSVDLGGAAFTFRYSGVAVGTPTLSDEASNMKIRSAAAGGELRVLVTPSYDQLARVPSGSHDLFTVPTEGDGRIELVESQLSDANGALMTSMASAVRVPASYALHQNYPNPFNAGTVIPFDLKSAGDWKLDIYNVAGQVIRTITGHDADGRKLVTWDGTSQDGRRMASGIYFYRVTAGDFTAVRKMTLLK